MTDARPLVTVETCGCCLGKTSSMGYEVDYIVDRDDCLYADLAKENWQLKTERDGLMLATEKQADRLERLREKARAVVDDYVASGGNAALMESGPLDALRAELPQEGEG